jgi:pimeloyl-ACP methyl ester carboxylesterase
MNCASVEKSGWPDDAAALAGLLAYWRAPAGVRRAYADGPYGQTHFRYAQPEVPERPAVVLLHQTPSSGRPWEGVLARLGRTRVAIAPDTPGFGDSDGPDEPVSIADYAAALAATIKELGIGPVDLVGDHTGAKIAAEIARREPALVRKLVLYGAPVYSAEQRSSQRAVLARKATEAAAPPPEAGDFLIDKWRNLQTHYAADAPLGLIDRDFAESLRAQARAWWGYQAAYGYSYADVLPGLTQPLLLIAANDGLGEETQRAAALSPAATLVHQRDWRVGAISQHAEELTALLQTFLDTEPAAAAPVLTPRTDRSASGVRRLFADAADGQMHLRVAGAGGGGQPPLFCFHMSPRSGHYFEALLTALAGDRQVFAPDTPGYGESYKPEQRLDVPGYARAMASMIDGMALRTVDLLGDHTGTKVAIELARQRPDLVRRVVMNTAGVYSAEEQRAWQGKMGTIEVQADGSHYAALWARYQRLNRGKLAPDQIAFRFYETIRAGPCMWWGPRAANMYLLGDVLPDIAQEIFLVCSDEDSLIEPSRRGAGLLRNGRYKEYAGLGNSMMEHRVADVAGDIDAFLRG